MEDHAARRRVGGGHDGGRRQRAVLHVARDLLEVDQPFERAAQRRGVEQPVQVGAGQAGEHRGRAQQTAELGRRHQRAQRVAPAQLTPHLDAGRGDVLQRLVRARRDERSVERADAGPDDDVRRLAARGERRRQRGQRTGLVGAARAASGEHERDPLTRRPRPIAVLARRSSSVCRPGRPPSLGQGLTSFAAAYRPSAGLSGPAARAGARRASPAGPRGSGVGVRDLDERPLGSSSASRWPCSRGMRRSSLAHATSAGRSNDAQRLGGGEQIAAALRRAEHVLSEIAADLPLLERRREPSVHHLAGNRALAHVPEGHRQPAQAVEAKRHQRAPMPPGTRAM